MTTKSLPRARHYLSQVNTHWSIRPSLQLHSMHGAEKQHGLEHSSIAHIRYAVTVCYSKLNCRTLPYLVNKLIQSPKIWIHLPFIGKRGNLLIKSCTSSTTKIIRLLKQRAQFITIYDTTSTNTFLSVKDRTPKELQSSVVYTNLVALDAKLPTSERQILYVDNAKRACPK